VAGVVIPDAITNILTMSNKTTPFFQNCISIDWLSFHFPYENLSYILGSISFSGDLEFGKGKMNKKFSCILFEGITIFIDYDQPPIDIERPTDIQISFSGSGLAYIDQLCNLGYADLLAICFDVGGRPARIDIAYDDFNKKITPRSVYDVLLLDDVVTRWRKFEFLASHKLGGGSLGETLYIGVRGSSSYCRIYDKKAQMLFKKIRTDALDHWVRCELEMKRNYAIVICQKLHALSIEENANIAAIDRPLQLPCSSHAAYLQSYLLGKLHLKESAGPDRKQDRDTLSWWLDFCGGADPVLLVIPRPSKTLESSSDWLYRSTAATLAMVVDALGGRFKIDELLAHGRKNLKNSHNTIILSTKKLEAEREAAQNLLPVLIRDLDPKTGKERITV
jgi:hypothetical protein